MTEQRARVLEEKRHTSSNVTTMSRYVGFGLVAATFTILTTDQNTSLYKLFGPYRHELLFSALLGALTIAFDYLQFMAGYISVERALNNPSQDYGYDKQSLAWKLRDWMFWGKQWTAIGGVGSFALIVLLALLTR